MTISQPSSRFFVATMAAILVFGAGLTSPIWFLLDGLGPLEAMRAGLPIVAATSVGIVIASIIGMAMYRVAPGEAPASQDQRQPDAPWKNQVIHLLTILMFVVPFLSILVGYLLRQFISFDPG